MWHSLSQIKSTLAILGVPVQNLIVEPATQEVFTIVSELYVSHSLCVPNVGVSVSFVLYDVKKMHFTLWGTQ
jgi:hypothetical protein